MGVFPSIISPPSTEIAMVNMILPMSRGMFKGKEIAETCSLGSHKSLYHAIQSTSDAYVDDQHLVASDPYHILYLLDSPLTTLDYL